MSGIRTIIAHIAANTALSPGVFLTGKLVGVKIPATWTAAAMSFRSSVDAGVTYFDVYRAGNELVFIVNADTANMVDEDVLGGGYYLAVRSGTSGAPINQTNAGGVDITISVLA